MSDQQAATSPTKRYHALAILLGQAVARIRWNGLPGRPALGHDRRADDHPESPESIGGDGIATVGRNPKANTRGAGN